MATTGRERRARERSLCCVLAATVVAGCGAAEPPPSLEAELPRGATEEAHDRLHAVAVEAYVFGYPAVEIERTRRVATNVESPVGKRAPMNQFGHADRLLGADDREVVTPNNDTPYSAAFLDLSAEPLVLHVPAFGERYFVLPLLDAYHEHFCSIGQRAEGPDGERAIAAPDGGDFAIVGPGFAGTLPEGLTRIDSPTNIVWIIGRPLVHGPEDLPRLMALKRQLSLTPLSAYGGDYTPPPGRVVQLDPEVAALGTPLLGPRFYEVLDGVLRKNPLPPELGSLAARFASVGLGSGAPFDPDTLDEATRTALQRASEEAVAAIRAKAATVAPTVRGWDVAGTVPQGLYHGDYLVRAAFALYGLGLINIEEAAYFRATRDAEGRPLEGGHRYTLRFAAEAPPPASAFWSLTMYGEDMFFVDNPIDRYSLGDRSELRTDEDGSTTLYLQADPPEEELRSNWLPAPPGGFYVILRLYHPAESVQQGRYVPPGIERLP